MIEKSSERRGRSIGARPLAHGAAELAVQVTLVGAGWMLVTRMPRDPDQLEHVVAVLALSGGVAASVLLLVAAWMSADRPAWRLAGAVAVFTGVVLLIRAVRPEPGAVIWSALTAGAVLGVLALLVLAARDLRGHRPPGTTRAVGLAMLAAATAVTGSAALLPLAAVRLCTWPGVAAAGLLVAVLGLTGDRPLARRIGLAFVTVGLAHAGGPPGTAAVELAAVGMFLLAAVPFLVGSVRNVGRQQEASRIRLAEAEAVMASVAERDHEMRNLVAGLTGAATLLRADEVRASADGRRLRAAAEAELTRLQRMLDARQASPGPAEAAVGPVLRDLASVHGACGMDVRVEVDGDPRVAMAGSALAQVIANLLMNCRRHAPGARVRLRADRREDEVRIEVADDGPGLPDGWSADILRRGVRGPGSTGDGLGLAITTELVRDHGGTLTLRSDGAGCAAVIDLPALDRTPQHA